MARAAAFVLSFSILALSPVSPARAQDASVSVLNGSVIDVLGAPVVGATVVVTAGDNAFDPVTGVNGVTDILSFSAAHGLLTGDAVPELQHYRTIWVPDMSNFVGNEIAFSPTGNQLALLVSSSVVKIFPTAENNTSEIIINDPFASIADITITPEGEIRALSCSGTAVDILKLPSAIPIDEWYFDEPTCGQLLDHGASVAISEPYEPVYLYRVGEYVPPVIVKGRTFSSDGSVGAAGVPVSSSGDPETVAIWQKEFGLTQKWDFYQEEYNDFG